MTPALQRFDAYLQAQGVAASSRKIYLRLLRRWTMRGAGFEQHLQSAYGGAPAGTVQVVNAALRHWRRMLGQPDAPPIKAGKQHRERQALERPQLDSYLEAVALVPARNAHLPPEVTQAVVTVLRLLPETGLRISEMCGLHRQNLRKIGDRWWIRFTGKGNKERSVPLNDTAQDLIRRYLTARSGSSPYLFPSPSDPAAPLRTDLVRKCWRTVRPIDLGDVTPHTLRHTFCTTLVEADVDVRTVQELAGHQDLRTTMRYVHPSKARKVQAVDRLLKKDPEEP